MSGLTKEQLDKFEKDGILVVDNFLSPDEVTAIRFDGCCILNFILVENDEN